MLSGSARPNLDSATREDVASKRAARSNVLAGALAVLVVVGIGMSACGRMHYELMPLDGGAVDVAPLCDPGARDVAVENPLVVVGAGGHLAALTTKTRELWLRSLDEGRADALPILLGDDLAGSAHAVPTGTPNHVLVAYESVENGWSAIKLVDVDLVTTTLRKASAFKSGRHEVQPALGPRAGGVVLAYKEEDHTAGEPPTYRTRLERRADLTSPVVASAAAETVTPKQIAPMPNDGLALLGASTADFALLVFDAGPAPVGGGVHLAGDAAALAAGGSGVDVVRAAAGGLDVSVLATGGSLQGTPSVIKPTGGGRITRLDALRRPEGLYVAYVQDGVASSLLVTDGTVRQLAAMPAATGGVWLFDEGGAAVRAAERSGGVRIERLCP